jgi:hypothetical protein
MKISWDESTQSVVLTAETVLDGIALGYRAELTRSDSETSCKSQSDRISDTHTPETEDLPAEPC